MSVEGKRRCPEAVCTFLAAFGKGVEIGKIVRSSSRLPGVFPNLIAS